MQCTASQTSLSKKFNRNFARKMLNQFFWHHIRTVRSIWFRTKICTWLCSGNFFQKCGKNTSGGLILYKYRGSGPQKVVNKYCQNILTPYLISFFSLLACSFKIKFTYVLQKLHHSPVPHIPNYFLNELHIFPSRKYLNKGVEVHTLLHTVHNSICICIPANS